MKVLFVPLTEGQMVELQGLAAHGCQEAFNAVNLDGFGDAWGIGAPGNCYRIIGFGEDKWIDEHDV